MAGVIKGIGVDLLDLARFEAHLAATPALIERLFHPEERTQTTRRLAASFAAKEALVKALGGPTGLSWSELKVWRNTEGQPFLAAEGKSAGTLAQAGIDKIHLSISHDGGMLIAYLIAEGADSA